MFFLKKRSLVTIVLPNSDLQDNGLNVLTLMVNIMTWWDDFHINKHSTFIIYDYFCHKVCGVTVTVPGSLDLSVRRLTAHTHPDL